MSELLNGSYGRGSGVAFGARFGTGFCLQLIDRHSVSPCLPPVKPVLDLLILGHAGLAAFIPAAMPPDGWDQDQYRDRGEDDAEGLFAGEVEKFHAGRLGQAKRRHKAAARCKEKPRCAPAGGSAEAMAEINPRAAPGYDRETRRSRLKAKNGSTQSSGIDISDSVIDGVPENSEGGYRKLEQDRLMSTKLVDRNFYSPVGRIVAIPTDPGPIDLIYFENHPFFPSAELESSLDPTRRAALSGIMPRWNALQVAIEDTVIDPDKVQEAKRQARQKARQGETAATPAPGSFDALRESLAEIEARLRSQAVAPAARRRAGRPVGGCA